MFSLYTANKSISFVHQLKKPKAAGLLSRSSTTCKSAPWMSEWGRKERHRASTQSDLHFFQVPAALNKQVQFRVSEEHSPAAGDSLHDVSLLPVSSHSSRYSTHIFQTCLRPCSSQELTLTVATATGKLCCWMTQFLNSHILHSQWFAVFASKKSTKGQCPLCHLPKMWARRQRTRLGGRARQVKHRLQFCFVFVSQVLSGNWMLVCISGP